ncbi:MAG: peptide chain release factor N(5)-glutamine methyltransferase [Fimbriimonadaceae bacterium]|nr:peptide chain release factor N(5)-glutamine methyltransferase [Fimbriimonadaceae bacterium]
MKTRQTIGEVRRAATARLAAAGIAEAAAEADWLLAERLGCSRTLLAVRAGEPWDDDPRWEDWMRRRAAREPLAYVLGHREFYGLALQVTPAVLVPRWDSEALVEALLQRLPADQPLRLADLGCGSGALGLALAAQRPRAEVWLVDCSRAALQVALANAARLGLDDRVQGHCGDFADLLPALPRCDGVISNPPYIASGELAALEPEVRDHEPRLALDGGADGLQLYPALLRTIGRLLRPGGWAAVECGDRQTAAVAALGRAAGLLPGPEIRDLGGRPRGCLLEATA